MKKIVSIILAMVFLFIAGCASAAPAQTSSTSGTAAQQPSETTSTSSSTADELTEALNSMKPVALNFGVSLGASHGLLAGIQEFADKVTEATDGKVTFTLYPGESLVKNSELYTSLLSGAVDIVETDPGYSVAYFPYITIYSQSGTDYASYYATNKVINKLLDKNAYDIPDLDNSEILFGFNMTTQTGIAYNGDAVTELADMKGLQLRGTGYAISMINALGATPVGIGMAECYEALTKGTIDAAITSWEAMYNWKLAEVTKSYLNLSIGVTSFHIVAINKDVWDAFPAPVQEVIKETADEVSFEMADLAREGDKKGYDLAIQNGVVLKDLTDAQKAEWVNALSGVKDEWIANTVKLGYSEDEVRAWVDYFNSVREEINKEYPTAP
ncbi:MAG: TRAP transporter substrate-binding protein [Oscillospiraceae bacterium]